MPAEAGADDTLRIILHRSWVRLRDDDVQGEWRIGAEGNQDLCCGRARRSSRWRGEALPRSTEQAVALLIDDLAAFQNREFGGIRLRAETVRPHEPV